jgi:protein-L-isoaspartate(D-aspartate) O-methyltransferase
LGRASLRGPALVRDPALLEALRRVPRHAFAPPELRDRAYEDTPLPFYEGRALAKPSLMAQMIELLGLGPTDRVLELGTCTGWQTALLAHLAAEVHSVEPSPQVSSQAAERLTELGYERVQLRWGDPLAGWPEAAPFDAVLVTGALDQVPPAVWTQLQVGGRMLLPLAPPGQPQRLVLLVKRGERDAAQTVLGEVQFHALPAWRGR